MVLCVLLFFCLFLLTKSACPNGTLSWKEHCYSFVTNATGFALAEISCNNAGGNLISVHDAFSNVVIGQEAQKYFHESTESNFWVGGNNLEENGNWSWTDGMSFNFCDWSKGEPQNATGLNCAAISFTDASWSSQDCFKPKPFVCSVPTSSTIPPTTTVATTTRRVLKCPPDWIYLNYTGYCYKVYHNNLDQNGAEQICIVEGGHLASIHSNTENDFLGNLQFVSGRVWIGLKVEFDDNWQSKWVWTDKTSVDYTNWSVGQPDDHGSSEGCTEFYNHYAWNDIPCDRPHPNFVCKKYRSYM
uniref:C-type lectin domain-containing protein n=1 Tax=Panagrolaimus sp. ES5 TaxID=591445 RepID=A0AC34G3E9_9BILA